MVVTFYKNSSPAIQVNKELSMSKDYECQLKFDCSILEPVLIVSEMLPADYNYFYIPDFGGRYYFYSSPVTREANIIEVHGIVDPLMSFKTDLLNSTGIIERNENEFTKYIQDSKYSVLSYERIQTKIFPNSFPNNGEFILVVAGS